MKKLLIAVALIAATGVQLFGQGTIDFRNRVTAATPPLNAPVYMRDGTTLLGDANYVAQLYYSATQTGSYTPVTAAAAPFRTGAGAGYWNPGTDSTRLLTGITAGNTVWLEVRVWNSTLGATYDAARAAGSLWGESNPFSVVSGGGGVPPAVPAVMAGLTSFNLVPEPTTIALGVLGLAGLLVIRRRK